MSIHRLIYAWMVNSIPMGVGQNIPVLDHLCNNTSCCNPKHLILGPQKYNILRGNSPITLNAKKTHCHRGHLLPIEPNESWGNKRKNRRCIICRRMNAKTRYHSKVSGINSQTFLESTREYSRKLWHGPKHQEFLEKHRKSNLLSYHRRRSLIVPPAD